MAGVLVEIKNIYIHVSELVLIAGFGRAISLKLAELGAKVHAISRTQEDLDSLKQEVHIYHLQEL